MAFARARRLAGVGANANALTRMIAERRKLQKSALIFQEILVRFKSHPSGALAQDPPSLDKMQLLRSVCRGAARHWLLYLAFPLTLQLVTLNVHVLLDAAD